MAKTRRTLAAPKSDVPHLFCEWVVGTTIAAALEGPRATKPRGRDVVQVEVTTDDESEQDTLRVTYPRTSRWSALAKEEGQSSAAIAKQVRFASSPRKSSMKKTTGAMSSSVSDDADESTEESASESAPSSDSSASGPSGPSSAGSGRPKRAKDKKGPGREAQRPGSEDESASYSGRKGARTWSAQAVLRSRTRPSKRREIDP